MRRLMGFMFAPSLLAVATPCPADSQSAEAPLMRRRGAEALSVETA